MTQDATELLKRALALSEEERAELAGSLLESLDGPRRIPQPWKPPGAKKSPAALKTSIPAKPNPFPGKRSVSAFRPNDQHQICCYRRPLRGLVVLPEIWVVGQFDDVAASLPRHSTA